MKTKPIQGSIPGTSYNYSNDFQRWVYKNIPAFKNEKYITTPNDYLAKIEFELQSEKLPGRMIRTHSTTWNAIVNDLMSSDGFGVALNRKGIVKELTEQINPTDPPAKKQQWLMD